MQRRGLLHTWPASELFRLNTLARVGILHSLYLHIGLILIRFATWVLFLLLFSLMGIGYFVVGIFFFLDGLLSRTALDPNER